MLVGAGGGEESEGDGPRDELGCSRRSRVLRGPRAAAEELRSQGTEDMLVAGLMGKGQQPGPDPQPHVSPAPPQVHPAPAAMKLALNWPQMSVRETEAQDRDEVHLHEARAAFLTHPALDPKHLPAAPQPRSLNP